MDMKIKTTQMAGFTICSIPLVLQPSQAERTEAAALASLLDNLIYHRMQVAAAEAIVSERLKELEAGEA